MVPILLRDLTASDLPIFFEQQCDPEANLMAAFPSRDREDFNTHWAKIMVNNTVILKTILHDDQVAGYLVSFLWSGEREVGYWLGREFWGKGIATRALAEFLKIIETRPLFARTAKHNIGSRRVLEKCGFSVIGEDTYLNIHNEDVNGFVLKLEN